MKQNKQVYTLNCDCCGIPYNSNKAFPSPQLCPLCENKQDELNLDADNSKLTLNGGVKQDSRIEEVKKILEVWQDAGTDYIVAFSFKGVAHEIDDYYSQLFPPLTDDKDLRVLANGEWVKASEELKETVRSIEQALPDKDLREKIAIKTCDEFGSDNWIDLPEGERQDYYDFTDQLIPLLQPKPRIDEQALTELAEILYNFKDGATIESIRGTLESHFLVGTSEHWKELAKKEEREHKNHDFAVVINELLDIGKSQEQENWTRTWFVVKDKLLQIRQTLKGGSNE